MNNFSFFCKRIKKMSDICIAKQQDNQKTGNKTDRTMTEFIERIKKSLLEEKGINLEDAGYMELPKERNRYNASLVIGNVNLIAGRFKTETEVSELVDEFMSKPVQ